MRKMLLAAAAVLAVITSPTLACPTVDANRVTAIGQNLHVNSITRIGTNNRITLQLATALPVPNRKMAWHDLKLVSPAPVSSVAIEGVR